MDAGADELEVYLTAQCNNTNDWQDWVFLNSDMSPIPAHPALPPPMHVNVPQPNGVQNMPPLSIGDLKNTMKPNTVPVT